MSPETQTGMVGVPAAAMEAVHAELRRGRSATEGADLARRIGFAFGPAMVNAFEARLSQEGHSRAGDLPPDEFWSRLSGFLATAGWGEIEIEDSHPGVVTVTSANWAEPTGRSTAYPSCHLTTGMLAAVVSQVAGTDLAVLETSCRAAGSDRCSFLVGGQAALSAVHGRLREGAAPAEAVSLLG